VLTHEQYQVNVSRVLLSLNQLEKKINGSIRSGGHWLPVHCQAEQRTAIIVCYRDRASQLNLFLEHLHPFLQWQQLDYTIIVVNQHGNEEFNRGALFNIGYLEAMKFYPFTCFIFHDVDLLPEDRRNIYKCQSRPLHL
jgi:hypothetical protein